MLKTLLVDGNWNLKRNYYRGTVLDVYGEKCNGTYGFLTSLFHTINKVLPDRVIVCWDGIKSGRYRYEIYKPYKANRKKDWFSEEKAILEEGVGLDPESKEKYEILTQKIRVKNLLEDLYVRQVEVDYIEGDDLIAQYCLNSQDKEYEEEIIIFSRDQDYYQLLSDCVSILTPDSLNLITNKNFKNKFGYTLENVLLFKCFEGDSSDNISGVKGITKKTLIKYFPEISNRKYTYKEIMNECLSLKKQKEHKNKKTLDKIMEAEEVLYRNAKLMNLKKPFINKEVEYEIDRVSSFDISSEDRSIKRARLNMKKQGFLQMMEAENILSENFFSPFFRLKSKEKKHNRSNQ